MTIEFTVVDEMLSPLRMVPNPATDAVSIAFEDGTRAKLIGTLANFFGQVIYSNLDIDLESNENVSIDVSLLPSGIYILQLTDEKGTVVSQEKLVKQ